MTVLNKFLDKYGWAVFLRLAIYPVTLLLFSPIRYLQALFNSIILTKGKWSEYIGFDVSRSINCLFYWNDALNIDRYGRTGISKYKGLGDADLSKLFKYSLPSLYAYWSFGAVLPLVCMFGWWVSYFLWFDAVELQWGLLVISLGILSTTSFAATFSFQNYNILGWMFFPLGLWAMFNEQYAVAVLAWVLSSFGSITVVAIAIVLTLAFSLETYSVFPVLCVLPALAKVLTHFFHTSSNTSLLESILLRATAIGLTSKGVRYRRKHGKKITTENIYFFIIYSVFLISWYLLAGDISVIWLAALLVYFINVKIMRFADDQSIHMMMLGLSVTLMLQRNEPIMLLPYWLTISPLPLFLLICTNNSAPDIPPLLKPFRVQAVLDRVDEFISPVKKNQRIMMAFNDPNGIYENIFDGYRRLLEAPLYAASKRKIHFFPDWWAVFDTNYFGAPDFWGTSLEKVNENSKNWKCNFVVIYQNAKTELDEQWEKAGYRIVSYLDWSDQKDILRNETPWRGATPKWWLLQVPNKIVSESASS